MSNQIPLADVFLAQTVKHREEAVELLRDGWQEVSDHWRASIRARMTLQKVSLHVAVTQLCTETPNDGPGNSVAAIMGAAADLLTTAASELLGLADPTPGVESYEAILRKAVDEAPRVREGHGEGGAALEVMARLLEGLPSYLLEGPWRNIGALDVQALIEGQTGIFVELQHLDHKPIQVVWRTLHAEKTGMLVKGTAQANSRRARETWTGLDAAPLWCVTLALDVWLLATPRERARLLHHELMHCDILTDDAGNDSPAIRPHDIEEVDATVGRFGPASARQLALAIRMLRHPDVPQMAAAWRIDLGDVGPLLASLPEPPPAT